MRPVRRLISLWTRSSALEVRSLLLRDWRVLRSFHLSTMAATWVASDGQIPDLHLAILPDEQQADHRARHHTLPYVDFPAAFGSL